MNTKERVIQFLLSIERQYRGNGLQIDVSRNKFNCSAISDIGEEEFIKILSILEVERLIEVNFPTGRKNLQYSITVKLFEPIINYFSNKKIHAKKSRRELFNEIRAWITLLISICAFALSIYSLYLQYAQPK
jgi:hypothetical protein